MNLSSSGIWSQTFFLAHQLLRSLGSLNSVGKHKMAATWKATSLAIMIKINIKIKELLCHFAGNARNETRISN